MRQITTVLGLVLIVVVACETNKTPPPVETDASGLVRIPTAKGNLFAHPARSIDDYDDILLGDVRISYAPDQQPLSEIDAARLRMMTYDIVTKQIPAAGQLVAAGPAPCTVKLGVELTSLSLKQGAPAGGGTTISMEFRDSLTDDPIVRYGQRRSLDAGPSAAAGSPDLEGLRTTLATVATDFRGNFRHELPLNATGARAAQGCKGTIGRVRKAAKEAE
jgi:hypothetical protein